MAKFRNGNLVLANTQSIIHGVTTIVDNTRKASFNKIQLDLGTTIEEFSIDGTMIGNSDTALPTEKAVVTYVAAQLSSYSTNKIYQLDSKVEVTDTGTDGAINFTCNNVKRWQIDSVGRLFSSNSTDPITVSVSSYLQVLGVTSAASSQTIARFSDDTAAPGLRFMKSRSTTIGTQESITTGDVLGDIYFYGDDGVDFSTLSGRISLISEGSSVGVIPGRMIFYTANSSGTSTARLNLYSDGRAYVNGILQIDGTTKTNACLYAGTTDPDGSARLNYDGYFYATRVYNAVWNDIADFQDLDDELIPGKCYYDDLYGAKICNIRCQQSVIGIASDTYGYGVGQSNDKRQVPIAVCGWVLAYVNGNCEMGDALSSDYDGNLMKMTEEEKRRYPERIVAIYKKRELAEEFGTTGNKIKVNGRHWVKVK